MKTLAKLADTPVADLKRAALEEEYTDLLTARDAIRDRLVAVKHELDARLETERLAATLGVDPERLSPEEMGVLRGVARLQRHKPAPPPGANDGTAVVGPISLGGSPQGVEE